MNEEAKHVYTSTEASKTHLVSLNLVIATRNSLTTFGLWKIRTVIAGKV